MMIKKGTTHFKLIGWCFILFMLFSSTSAIGQAPKTEIRAVWVATVSNLDFPVGSNRFNMQEQKRQINAILDTALSLNLNSIFFQVRPMCDALYISDLVPWSQYISGTRGNAPGYDPLDYFIEEAHKRGLELHGWLNPYRFESFLGQHANRPGNFLSTHPEWVLSYDDYRILDPGVPEVQEHLKDIVGEIINNYDIDGIHFDDYFYQYGGTTDEDATTFANYKGNFTDIGDWRRNNINNMIDLVYDTIQSVKPHVRFGISPFGIYGNNENPPGIVGLDAFNRIYTDPKQWLSSGNIDYINPQLYWPIGGSQDFDALTQFWAQLAKDNNRHMIAGHGIYRYENAPDATARIAQDHLLHENKHYFDWETNTANRVEQGGWTLDQITRQINITRDNRDINAVGGVYFRYQDFIRVEGLAQEIKDNSYNSPALMPSMPWKNQPEPSTPQNAEWVADDQGVSFVSWDAVGENMRYVVYASANENPDQGFFDDPANILKVVYTNAFYLEGESDAEGKPYLFIKAYDRFGNESASAVSFSVELPSVASVLASPADGASGVSSSTDFVWSSVPNAQFYKIEFSETSTFDQLAFESTVNATTLNAAAFSFKGDQTYYWRIASGNFIGFGITSAVFSFTTGFPGTAEMIYPVANEQLVDLQPLIKWQPSDLVAGVRIQIARGGAQFETFNVIIDEELGAVSEYQVPQMLNEWTTHHMRIQLYNDLGQGSWEYTSFKTLKELPLAPIILSPQVSDVFGDDQAIQFSWSLSELATGYQAILSEDADRNMIVAEREFFSRNNLVWDFGTIEAGIYYFNVSGKNVGGLGEWAQRSFTIEKVLSVKDQRPALWAVYDNNGTIAINVPARAESKIDLKVIDLLGRPISMQPVTHRNDSRRVYELDQSAFHGIALAIVAVDGVTYQIKIKGK